MNEILNYEIPIPLQRRLSLRTAAYGGVIAGTLTTCSVLIVGPLCLVVGLVATIVVSAAAARASPGFEFRAGFLASGFMAAAAVVAYIILIELLLFSGSFTYDELVVALLGDVLKWWAIFSIPGLFGSAWYWKSRRKRPAGLCAICGYDLRATPDRCPECGTVPPVTQAAT